MLNNLHELRAFIQKNCPMFLTNDLTLYAIIGKVVWYCNELIRRSNELNELLGKLEDLTEEELKRLNNLVDQFIKDTNKNFEDFKTEINTDLAGFKKTITDNYNTFTQGQLDRLDELLAQLITALSNFKTSIIKSYNDWIEEKQTTINNQITQWEEQFTTLGTSLNNNYEQQVNEFKEAKDDEYDTFKNDTQELINQKNQEIDTILAGLPSSIQQEVIKYINETYITSTEFNNLLRDILPVIINLSYMGERASFPDIKLNYQFLYATDENKLYWIDNHEPIEITSRTNRLYYYDGLLYLWNNKTDKLEEIGYNLENYGA